MKKIYFFMLIIFFPSVINGTLLPTNKNEFCSRFANLSILAEFSADNLNMMSFKNQGGLFDGGVCWWHSRFQRNIFYLAIFNPSLNRPNLIEAKRLIKEIRLGKNIITIPGFSNFNEFSDYYKKEILNELEDWQLYDGIVLGRWIDGLKGDTKVKPEVLHKMMDESFNYTVNEKRIGYHKLQIKGITSHAWLITGMKKFEQGYEIGFIDSNNPLLCQNYSYKYGDESFYDKSYGDFVPYLEFKREEIRLGQIASAFCGKLKISNRTKDHWDEDYKLDLEAAKKIH